METIKAVIFDIDGTLAPDISWLSLTRDLGASTEEHIQIYQDYKAGAITYDQSKSSLIGLWQATGNASRAFLEDLFEEWPLFPDASKAVSIVQVHYPTCIITGSMDLYAKTVSQKLGVAEYFANTTLIWDGQGKLVDMDYELDQTSKKLEQYLGYCLRHNLQPTECAVVGDGENDVELFKASGKGIAIGTEIPNGLRLVAWQSISSLIELPAVLGIH